MMFEKKLFAAILVSATLLIPVTAPLADAAYVEGTATIEPPSCGVDIAQGSASTLNFGTLTNGQTAPPDSSPALLVTVAITGNTEPIVSVTGGSWLAGPPVVVVMPSTQTHWNLVDRPYAEMTPLPESAVPPHPSTFQGAGPGALVDTYWRLQVGSLTNPITTSTFTVQSILIIANC